MNLTMNLPNAISLIRSVAAFVFLYFALAGEWRIAFPIFWIAALTDMIDGSLARLLGQRTRLGAFLDPMADKLLMFFGFLSLTIHRILPLPLTGLVVARDLLIVLGLVFLKWRRVPVVYRPTYLSKATTFFQILTLLGGLLSTQGIPAASYDRIFSVARLLVQGVTALLTAATGVQYFRMGWRMLPNAKTETHRQ